MAETKRDRLKQRGGTTPSGITDLMARMAAGVQNTDTLPVVIAPDKTIRIGDSFIIRENSLEIAEHVGRDEWLTFVQWLYSLDDTLQWATGDAVVFADAKRAVWIAENDITEEELESKYKDLLETTGYAYSTLRKFASYARSIPPFRRRNTLSYSHHVEIASIPDEQQDAWLDQAESKGWSRNELRAEIAKSKLVADAGPGDNTTIVPAVDAPALSDEDEEAVDLIIEDIADVIHEKRIIGFRKKVQQNRLADIDMTEIIAEQNYLAHLRKKVAAAKVEADKQARARKN